MFERVTTIYHSDQMVDGNELCVKCVLMFVDGRILATCEEVGGAGREKEDGKMSSTQSSYALSLYSFPRTFSLPMVLNVRRGPTGRRKRGRVIKYYNYYYFNNYHSKEQNVLLYLSGQAVKGSRDRRRTACFVENSENPQKQMNRTIGHFKSISYLHFI